MWQIKNPGLGVHDFVQRGVQGRGANTWQSHKSNPDVVCNAPEFKLFGLAVGYLQDADFLVGGEFAFTYIKSAQE